MITVLLTGCSKSPGIKTVYFTYENNTGHDIELMTGTNGGLYEMYAEIPNGESATFVYYGSDDSDRYKIYKYTLGFVFFESVKMRVDHKYIRVWGFWDDKNLIRDNVNPGYDYHASIRTDFLEFKKLPNICQCVQRNNNNGDNFINTYSNGIIHRTITLDEPYYLDTKLNFYYKHKFFDDNTDRPWVLIDGEYRYDDSIFSKWEEGSAFYQEYLKLSNEEFDKDRDDALAYMAKRP